MFAYAVRRKYAIQNPFKEINKPTGGTRPEVLTVEQTARLLEAASPEILPYIAIGAFAGLRASEIERLDWRDINFEENEIAVNSDNKSGALPLLFNHFRAGIDSMTSPAISNRPSKKPCFGGVALKGSLGSDASH